MAQLTFEVEDIVRTVETNEQYRGTKESFEAIWKALPPGRGGAVLDVGCGEHVWSASDYGMVVRVDKSVQQGEDFMLFDAESLGDWMRFRVNHVEAVVTTDVIEHLENPWAFMAECFRVARRSVAVSTPNVDSPLSCTLLEKTGTLWGFTPADRTTSKHITPIFLWQLNAMAKRAGWHIETTIRTSGRYMRQQWLDRMLPRELRSMTKDKAFAPSLVVVFAPSTVSDGVDARR